MQFEWKEAGLSVLVPSSCLSSVIGFRFRSARTVQLRLLIISWFWPYQGFAIDNKYTVFCVRHFGGVLEPLAAIIGRCSNRAEEFLQALVGQCVFNVFRNLRRLLHVSYSHQESARPLYSRLSQFIWQVWFLNPTARAWTSGIECLSRAVVAPRLMGVLVWIGLDMPKDHIDSGWIVLTSGDVTPRCGSNKGIETLYDSPRYIPKSEVNRIHLQTGLCYTSLRRCSSQAWSRVSCRFLALHPSSSILHNPWSSIIFHHTFINSKGLQ